MRTFLFLVLLLSVGRAAEPLQKDAYHLNAEVEKAVGYCQAIRVGDTLYISGSVGSGEMPQAIGQAYEELKTTLAAHGLTFQHVVKENVYAVNLDEFIKHKAVRRAYYGEDFPAATWVQVQRLYTPEFSVEVELVAVFPKEMRASRAK